MKVAVIGLGKLGLPMAAVFASKGHTVIAIDNNKDTIDSLMSGNCPIRETCLEEFLNIGRPNILFTSNISDVIVGKEPELVFVMVPTPSGKDNKFITTHIETVLEQLHGRQLPVVIVSTVMPGSCRQLSEKYGLRIFYSPEFIALGAVIKGMLYPDSILIGHKIGDHPGLLIDFHESIVGTKVPFHVMSWENAELSKLALNCYITMKVTFANLLAEVCESIPGGNVDRVTDFIGSDSRVGKKCLHGGLGFGGPCFPRDNEAFIAHKEFPLQHAIIDFNNRIPLRVLKTAIELVKDIESPRIEVLGTSYKSYTRITERSQSYQLLADLHVALPRASIVGTDPPCPINLDGVDLAIICLDYPEFHNLDISTMRHKRVLDCVRVLENYRQCDVYKAIGVQS